MHQLHAVLVVLLLCAFSTGCGSNLRVTNIQLGRSVNSDNTVAQHATTFAPSDTVYVSVLTAGRGSGTIGVRWLYEGRIVGEPTKQVSYPGEAATEFHLQNAGGFPPGNYSVEALLDGQPVGTKSFRVEMPR